MGLNTLGLGIILSLRDGASIPAARAATSLGQLDRAAQRFSTSFNSAMATAFEGMNMVAAGTLIAAAPIAFVKSTLKTQKALAYVASSGVKDLNRMKEAAEDFTNTWAGTTQESFLNSLYEIKSGLYTLTDEMVAKMTTTTGVLAKATKSTVDEMQSLLPIMWGILRPARGGITDEAFMNELAGGLAYSVKIYRATGKYMGDAFSQATSIATQQGISMEEQFAVLGQLQQTMTGSEAGTKMRALAVNVPRGVELAKKHDIDIQLTDTKGMILPLIDIISNVRSKYGERLNADAMEEVRKVFGSREATSTIINLLPYVDKMRQDSADIRKAMSEGMPVAMEMAKTAADQMGDSWEVFAQRINNLKQSIGEAIIPFFMPILNFVGNIVIGLQKLAKQYPGFIRLITAFASLISIMLITVGAVYILSAAFQIINAAMLLMKSRVALLRAEFMKFMITMWPLLLMAGLFYIAFKTNFMGVADIFNNTLKSIQKFFNNVKMVFDGLKELISTFADDKGMISEEMRQKLVDAGLWDITKKVFMIYTRLRYLWDGMKEGFKDFWTTLVAILKPIREALVEYVLKPLAGLLAKFGIVLPVLDKLIAPNQENANTWKEVGYWIGVVAGALMTLALAAKIIGPLISIGKFIFSIVKNIARLVRGVMTFGKILIQVGRFIWMAFMWVAGVVAAILGIPVWLAAVIIAAIVIIIVLIVVFRKQIWGFLVWLWGAIVDIFWTCIDAIVGFFKWLWSAIVTGWNAMIGFFVWLGQTIGAGFMWLVDQVVGFFVFLWDCIKAGANAFWNFLKWLGQQIAAGFKWVVDKIFGFFTWVWDGIKAGASLFWDGLKALGSGAFDGIKTIWNGLTKVFSTIWDTIKSVASGFFDWIAGKFKWITDKIDTVKGVFSTVGDTAGGVVDWVGSKMPWNAKGGIYGGPSIIGVGEVPGVQEAAIPLSGQHMMPFARAIADVMPEPVLDGPKTGVSGSTINTVINNNYNTQNIDQTESNRGSGSGSSEPRKVIIEVPVKINNREIARATAEYLDEQKRR